MSCFVVVVGGTEAAAVAAVEASMKQTEAVVAVVASILALAAAAELAPAVVVATSLMEEAEEQLHRDLHLDAVLLLVHPSQLEPYSRISHGKTKYVLERTILSEVYQSQMRAIDSHFAI